MFRSIPFALALLLPFTVLAQESSILRVLQADRLEVRTVGDVELRELVGSVRLQQDNVHISCDRATQNLTRNTVSLFGNVVIRQDTLLLRTNSGSYDANTKIARSYEGVHLYDGHVTLSAAIGSYATSTRIADFLNNVTIDDTAATIHAGAVTYDRRGGLMVATRKVRIRFKDEESLITADSVRHYPDEKRSQFFLDPVLWQIDTSYVRRDATGGIDSLALDTLNIAADRMEALRDSTNRFLTEGNVRMVRGGFSARGGSALFLRSDSLIILRASPVLWYDENQLTGDSVAARIADGELRHLHVLGNAFSISRSKPAEQDTLYPPDRFDQTTGKEIQMFFENDKPRHIRIEGSAISLYYLFDEGALNGVRRESGDLILLDFVEGDAKSIRTIGGVEGTYYPEKYVTGVESSYNLEGFVWREDRPVLLKMPEDATASDAP
ncbi:MAG: LPS export ABC transporter periplasmic protein LptC [Bacteroidia bacterium]|nr:LPS export ABC transporter periplasmic protein LptC [Bacteroidia bacterium]